MSKKRRTLSQSDKNEIGLKCCNCGSMEDLQYHHIIALGIGGEDINSNMCCLCFKCHYKLHHLKESNINNYADMIKKGQAKARMEGRYGGQKANEITIVKFNGEKYIGTSKQLSKIFKKDLRTIELWCKKGVPDVVKRKLNIKCAFYSKINHPGTKDFINIDIQIHNNNQLISVNNQLAFF